MDRRPRFEYGGTGSFEATFGCRAWDPSDSSVGGRRIAAAGMPAAYLVRRDSLVSLTLRVRESEWTDFLNFIIFGQTAASFEWFPDAEEATSFTVYLEAPEPGTEFRPARLGDYPRVFEASIVLRGAGIVIPWQEYFE